MSNNFWRSMFFGALLACFVGGGLLMLLCRQMSDQSYQRGLENGVRNFDSVPSHYRNQTGCWSKVDSVAVGQSDIDTVSSATLCEMIHALRDSLEECRKERGK